MQYPIKDYIFDSDRFILYRSDADRNTIEKLFQSISHDDLVIDELMNQDASKMSANRIAINSAGICLTYNCNLRCNYCGYSSKNDDQNRLDINDIKAFLIDIIRKRTIKKLISKKNDPLILYFTGGGEPTFEWSLFEQTIEFIKKQCNKNSIPFVLGMTTNGVLSNYQIEFIANNFDHVMISYDGLPEIQDSNRRSNSNKKTSSIVERSIFELAIRGVTVNIRSTLWQKDYKRIKEIYKHVFSLVPSNCKISWSIYPVLYEGRAIQRIKKQKDKTYKSFINYYVELVEEILSKEGVDKLELVNVPLLNNSLCELFCGAHRLNNPWLLPDRSIVTCIESREDKVIIGRVDNYNVEYYNNYCDVLLKISQEKYSSCKECIAYRICKGGCPIWHLRTNDDMKESLECNLQKEYIIYVLNSLLQNKYSFGWSLQRVIDSGLSNYEVYRIVKD